VPAYRSEKLLGKNIPKIRKAVATLTKDFEVLIVTGTNPDKTLEVAKRLEAGNKQVRVLHKPVRMGRGLALSLGFGQAKGDTAIYSDADLEISQKYLLELAKKLESGCDVAVASKHYPHSKFRSPFTRKLFGKTYTFLANTVLGGQLRDYQGGMKGFRRPVIRKILPYLKDKWWFWDTEALMLAQWLGFKVCEVPIEGSYGFGESTVNVWKDSVKQFFGILALKKRRLTELRKIKYIRSKQYYLVTLSDNSQHIVAQELINTYIESFGEKGGLEIAGHLRHSVELEQSAFQGSESATDEEKEKKLTELKESAKKLEVDVPEDPDLQPGQVRILQDLSSLFQCTNINGTTQFECETDYPKLTLGSNVFSVPFTVQIFNDNNLAISPPAPGSILVDSLPPSIGSVAGMFSVGDGSNVTATYSITDRACLSPVCSGKCAGIQSIIFKVGSTSIGQVSEITDECTQEGTISLSGLVVGGKSSSYTRDYGNVSGR